MRPLSRVRAGGSFWHPNRKPVGPVEIDWSHPLTRGLKFSAFPDRVLTFGNVSSTIQAPNIVSGRLSATPTSNEEYITDGKSYTLQNNFVFAFAAGYYTKDDNSNYRKTIIGDEANSLALRGNWSGSDLFELNLPWWGIFRTGTKTYNKWVNVFVVIRTDDLGTTRIYENGKLTETSTTVRVYSSSLPSSFQFYAGTHNSVANTWNSSWSHAYGFLLPVQNVDEAWPDWFGKWITTEPFAFLRPANERIWAPTGLSFNPFTKFHVSNYDQAYSGFQKLEGI